MSYGRYLPDGEVPIEVEYPEMAYTPNEIRDLADRSEARTYEWPEFSLRDADRIMEFEDYDYDL